MAEAAAGAGDGDGARSNRIELGSAFLLGVAATLMAVSAYLSSQTGDEQLAGFNASAAALTDANFFYQQGNQTIAEDTQLFVAWLQTSEAGGETSFITDLMSESLEASIEDWSETEEMLTPFDSDLYVVESHDTANEYQDASEAALEEAQDAESRGDQLELGSVVFATSLFAGGILNVFRQRRLQVALLLLGTALTALGLGVVLTGI